MCKEISPFTFFKYGRNCASLQIKRAKNLTVALEKTNLQLD